MYLDNISNQGITMYLDLLSIRIKRWIRNHALSGRYESLAGHSKRSVSLYKLYIIYTTNSTGCANSKKRVDCNHHPLGPKGSRNQCIATCTRSACTLFVRCFITNVTNKTKTRKVHHAGSGLFLVTEVVLNNKSWSKRPEANGYRRRRTLVTAGVSATSC